MELIFIKVHECFVIRQIYQTVQTTHSVSALMAATVLFLLFLAVVPTLATTDVYYITAGDSLSCPPHQICHNLSYYISQPDFFTANTIIVFLEGEHKLDKEDFIHISGTHNLTLKGQGQWPIAGAEETVMQSTVIINCTRGRGGFNFATSNDITVDGLTVINCGGHNKAALNFTSVNNINFRKNSIQHMTGYGLYLLNCNNVTITNSSYYQSAKCDSKGGGVYVGFENGVITQHTNTTYQVVLSHSNMTKCCNYQGRGAGIHLSILHPVNVLLSHLVLSQNYGGHLLAQVQNALLVIKNCIFTHSVHHTFQGRGISIEANGKSTIKIHDTMLLENSASDVSELSVKCYGKHNSFSLLNSVIKHTETDSFHGVLKIFKCDSVSVTNTSVQVSNQSIGGLSFDKLFRLRISNSIFVNGSTVPFLLLISDTPNSVLRNCSFLNNSGNSAITIYNSKCSLCDSTISNNNMTAITIIQSEIVYIRGSVVIQNNRYKEGAGITILLPGKIVVDGQLYMYNNTATEHGGAILVLSRQPLVTQVEIATSHTAHTSYTSCTLAFFSDKFGKVIFSGNKAKKGGSDIYGAKLMNCIMNPNSGISRSFYDPIKPIGYPNETSWYFDIPNKIMNHLNFSNTDRLSSMSSDPIMVCFCNTSILPDCSDRTVHHIQTYPGLEINTTLATVGYYGGISPGKILVNVRDAKLVRYYGQNENTKCFNLHLLLQNVSSTTALVHITVEGGLPDWGVSIEVEILDCPIGFILKSGQCQCDPFLANNNVQCNVSVPITKFFNSGNSWFSYNNDTQCITGTTNCPFDYCNRSNVSFDIMAPDRQCVANRAGILCGQCQSHLSIMLGSNHCGTCSNWYIFMLPVFALAGIVLVAVLMFLNLSVSVGTINGLLFYANMVKLNEAFFFPNGSVPVVSQFISWLNLDLGIEVCLFDGLDGYWNTWLQFAFPAYLFLLMGGIIVGCHYSVWLCRLCGSHAVPALATLFLMSYVKILLTVTRALSMSQLPCNDSMLTVWSVDGNIAYRSGKHLPLVIFSCGVLIVGLAYPVLVLCAPLLERYSHKCIPLHRWNPVTKLKPLLDAYGGPYKDKYRFWTGVTLMVRLMITVTFSFTSGRLIVINAFIIITIVVAILTFWSFTKGVYRSVYLSTLEVVYLLNICILSTVSLTVAFLISTLYNQIVTIVSVSFSFGVCLVTIAMHFKLNFNFKQIKRKLGFKDPQPAYIQVPQTSSDEDSHPPGSPPSIVYGSCRGEHQFVLEFPHRHHYDGEELELIDTSPVLLEREPLLFEF